MDFVITWVDGNDPEWRKEYNLYRDKVEGDQSAARFRDWDNLRYWFRGVEKFAPWVDKIHFVTWGHVPEWLNTDHPKLRIVKHTDYIPEKYLPTFNSHTIEFNFHLIEDLSEEFVYFNDDMFLIDSIDPESFFKNGKPCDMAVAQFYIGRKFNYILINNMATLKDHVFQKWRYMLRKPSSWFNFKYSLKDNWSNFSFLLSEPYIHTGFRYFHIAQPFLKSTLADLWKLEGERIDETCKRRFRTFFDVSPYLQRFWELSHNNFTPINLRKLGKVFEFRRETPEMAARFIRSQEKPLVCVNDHEHFKEFEEAKKLLNSSFDHILPDKSNFEK